MRILFVADRIPFPLHAGDAILTWHTLDYLARSHEVALITHGRLGADADHGLTHVAAIHLVPPRPLRGRRWRQLASLVGPRGAIEAMNRDPGFADELRRLLSKSAYDLVLVDHLRMGWVIAVVRSASPRTPIVFRSHNCETEVRTRYLERARSGLLGFALRWELEKTRRFEESVVRAVDAVVAITREDADQHRRQGARRVFEITPGFDFPTALPSIAPVDRFARSIALMGSFGYLAKEMNALSLVRDVFPRVRAAVPDARLFLVGSGPSARLRRAAVAAGGVTVTGAVPDARAVASRCEVFVMPTVVGGGFELKGLEAVAMGLPIVATPLAARGLDLEPGKSILVGSAPGELAEQLIRLLGDARAREMMAREAFSRLAPVARWASVNPRWEAVLRAVEQRA